MTSAKIVRAGTGWKLRDEDIRLWSSVEFVILKIIGAAGSGQLVSLDHVTPHWPRVFGYQKLHTAERFAVRAKTASLNAFQRMLAYCSYVVANTTTLEASSTPEQLQSLLSDPERVDHLFKKVGGDESDTALHVLVKFLWATLSEIQRTSNFAGIVVHNRKPYDYPTVRAMRRHGVPVYVCWDNGRKLKSYSQHHQHHILNDWAPSPDDFRALEQHPPSIADQPQIPVPVRYGPLPTIKSAQRFLDPMDYVRERKPRIELKLATSETAQSMKSRQVSAMKFGPRSHRGPHVYELERKEEVDQNTGGKIVYWERSRLDRATATTTYEDARPSQLWCAVFHFILRSRFLNRRPGSTVSLISGTSVRSSISRTTGILWKATVMRT